MTHFLITLLQILFLSSPVFSQVEVGNGGDMLHCQPSSGTAIFSGYYSLDYVATYDYGNENADIVELPFNAQLDRIESILYEKATSYWLSFKEYRKQLFQNNITNKYIWRGHPYGLISIEDERLAQILPPYCMSGNPTSNEEVIQAVIRETRPGMVIFNYDSNLIDRLNDNTNQMSFLVVHEWLWNFATNAGSIREVNRFLHSNMADSVSSSQLQLVFERSGLQIVPMNLRETRKGHRSILIKSGANGKPVLDTDDMVLMLKERYQLDLFNETTRKVKVTIDGLGFAFMEPGQKLSPSVQDNPWVETYTDRKMRIYEWQNGWSNEPSFVMNVRM
jgi:hypothetical protein